MKRTYLIVLLIGVLVGMVFAVHLSEAKYEPIIGDLNYTIESLKDEVAYNVALVNTCPESMICYEPYGANVEAEYILRGSIVLITFVDASEMPDDTEAYADWVVDFDNNVSLCVITAQFPTHILGDPIMDSIGHEFLHCIVGEFHP